MNKYLLILVFILSTFLRLEAEEAVHVIEIRYQVFVENIDSLSSYKYNLPYEALHVVSQNKVLTLNKYAADVDEIHLYQLDELLDYRCYPKEDGQNVAVKSSLQQIPTLVTNNNDERKYQIAGMLCKRYEILHKNTTVEIYTTDSFGVNFTPFSQISGYAMQYSFIDEVYGRVTYVAKSILPTMTDAATFSLADYKVTDEAFPADVRSPFDEVIVAKESNSLFKLNRKKITYNFKLSDKTKISEASNPDSLVVFAVGGFHKYNILEKDLLSGLIEYCSDKKVKFYHFALKENYNKREIKELESLGFDVAYLKDFILSKFKVQYYPTYILLDKDRKVLKYKIGTNSNMLTSFSKKILELSNSDF